MNPFDIFLPVWTPLMGVLEGSLHEAAIQTGSGALAIILITIVLKLMLLPLSLMQTRSMKAMQAVGPELAEIRKKYPKDRERLAQEQMRLYKEHGVNPAAGCLPMLPMMVVLIGLYQALINLAANDQLFQERWLWVERLDQPDIPFTLPGGIPIPGILPIVMLVTQFAYGKMTPVSGDPNDPQQQMMARMTTYFMPLMLFVFSFNFPAGLVLYWVVSNVFEIVRMGFTVGWAPLKPATLFGGAGAALRSFRTTGGSVRTTGGSVRSSSVDDDGSLRSGRANGGSGRANGGSGRANGGSPRSGRGDGDGSAPVRARADDAPTDGVNPVPSRPPGGSRRKKGKRGGKR